MTTSEIKRVRRREEVAAGYLYFGFGQRRRLESARFAQGHSIFSAYGKTSIQVETVDRDETAAQRASGKAR
jgi:hypothetical protein